ncbi:MAG: metal-dependent transcriptional regulator [Candidatus Hodarchaeota archaeon]
MVAIAFAEEELLEVLWVNLNEGNRTKCPLKDLDIGPEHENFDLESALNSLLRKKAIALLGDSKEIALTPKGQHLAEQAVRRHRLSERLFKDILQARKEELEGASCRFEHLLTPGIEENVCTLLGHPTHCPHGRPIPPGHCCKERRFQLESAVLPLSQISEGKEIEVAYISTRQPKRLNKLLSFGILPGTRIKLEKKTPALILKLDETVLALDKAIAKEIFCRHVNAE